MEFSLQQVLTVFSSAPLIAILMVGVFTIAALVYNATENRNLEEEKDNNFVLTVLSGMLILGLMIVVTQV